MTQLINSYSELQGNTSSPSSAQIDATGGNLLVVKVTFSGSGGATIPAPTVNGEPLTMIAQMDAWQAHTHIGYLLDPPQELVTVDFGINSIGNEVRILEVYSGAGLPEGIQHSYGAVTEHSVSVVSGSEADLLSGVFYNGSNSNIPTPGVGVTVHEQRATFGTHMYHAGTKQGADGAVTYSLSGVNSGASSRLSVFNIPDMSGPSITAASNITNETQPATITLANNENAPTAIQINGEAGSTIAFVSEDTEAGTETYSYLPPLIADDAEAELSVSVDGDTLTTTISYANSYDRDQLTHPATEAEYSTNSLSYPNAYGTSLPYEWKVITDASAAVVVIDWDALEAGDGFFKDIANYATPVANGSTTVTLGVFVPETGEAYLFDRTINVSDGSVVVEGQGLWRELFRDPTEELFTELFR